MSKINLKNLPDFKSIFERSSLTTSLSEVEQPKVVLITGAQGMLGHGLAVAISSLNRKEGDNKIQLILSSRRWDDTSIEFWEKYSNCDLILNDEVPHIKKQIDLVVHAASPSNITQISSFEALEWANLGLMREIFELNPHKFVFISSGEVYGGGKTDEDSIFNGFSKDQIRDWYPITKIASEDELRRLQSKQEVEVCVIRLFHTFGPGVKSNDGRSFADVLWGATLRREILLKSRGHQVRTFLYLSDAIEGIMLLAFRKLPGFNIVNLGSAIPYSIFEFAEIAASLTGASIIFDTAVTFQHSPNEKIIPNVGRLSQLGWNQKVTLEDGIRRTINWIRGSTPSPN